MPDAVDDPVTTPSTAEETAVAADADSPPADAASKAQDPSSSSSSATDAIDDKSVTDIANAISSTAVTDEDATPSSSVSHPPPAEPSQQQQHPPSAPAAGGVVAQQLPLNPPPNVGDDLDDDDDDDADAIDNEFLSLLPPCILPRIDRLKSLDARRDEILDEYRRERAVLEAKFSARMKPFYEQRRGVVIGEFDDMILDEEKKKKEDVVAEEGVVEDVNEEDSAGGEDGEDVKGIPQFWACAMGHVDVIAELITESDVDCLDHLTDITCNDFPDGLGFELVFHFSENPFFTNQTLTKRYEVPNLLTEDEPILKNVTGTEIAWKSGQSLTYREVTKKQRKKGGPKAGQIRTLKKRERTESFFHFFTPPKMPGMMDVMDEEEADEVEEAFDHDYDVAQAVRGHLIPRAVLWFTGEAMHLDDFEDEEAMMMEGEDGDGGEDDGNNGGQQGSTLNGENPFPPPAAGNGENPECVQN